MQIENENLQRTALPAMVLEDWLRSSVLKRQCQDFVYIFGNDCCGNALNELTAVRKIQPAFVNERTDFDKCERYINT